MPDAGGSGAVRVDVAAERREIPCLDRAALDVLVELGKRVERYFGSHQDVEWAIARGQELPRSLFVLQSRPVTALPRRETPPKRDSALAHVLGMFGAEVAEG